MKIAQITIAPIHALPDLLKKYLLRSGNAAIIGTILNNIFTNNHCGPTLPVNPITPFVINGIYSTNKIATNPKVFPKTAIS